MMSQASPSATDPRNDSDWPLPSGVRKEAGQRLKGKDGPEPSPRPSFSSSGPLPQAPPTLPTTSPAAIQRQSASPGGLPGSPQADLRKRAGAWAVLPSTSTRSSLLSRYLLPTSERQVLRACHPSLTPDAPITRPGCSSLRLWPGKFHLSPPSVEMKAFPPHRANLSDCCEAARPHPPSLLEE